MEFWNRSMIRTIFPLLVAFACLAGCASTDFVGRPGMEIVQNAELPPPTPTDLNRDQQAYLIAPFDELEVDVFGVPDLSREVRVDAGGNLALPLVGTISAAGRTPAQLAGDIDEGLRGRFVRDPSVTVNVKTVNRFVTVGGNVTIPGEYPVIGRMTLLRAIARARGTSEFAEESRVVVFREVNGQQLAALYDLRAINRGIYEDPPIYADDVISVGEDAGARIFSQVLQTSGILAAPLIAIIR